MREEWNCKDASLMKAAGDDENGESDA